MCRRDGGGHAVRIGGALVCGRGGNRGFELIGLAQFGRLDGSGLCRFSSGRGSGFMPWPLSLWLALLVFILLFGRHHHLAVDGDLEHLLLGRDLDPVYCFGGVLIGQSAQKVQPVARPFQL